MWVSVRTREDQVAIDALALSDESLPPGVFGEGVRVPYKEEEVLGTGDRDVHAPLVHEKTETALQTAWGVTSDTVDNDNIFLSALESVNRVDLDIE